jgi:hypothetical protein
MLATTSHGQKAMSPDDSLLVGTWKGTPSASSAFTCNDEITVYHISRGWWHLSHGDE